jgi:hypothetical protein
MGISALKDYLSTESFYNKRRVKQKKLSIETMRQIKEYGWDFNVEDFNLKVETAFNKIQHAWSNKNLKDVRHFISDGTFRRFSVQFEMMNLMEQTNELSNIKIHSIYPVFAEEDGPFDIIHVFIEASLKDQFISKRDTSLNSGGEERFVEYWSFMRSHDISTNKNIYSEKNCPACSAPLPDVAGESSICQYCNAVINSGKFDWVLAEISQESDWLNYRDNRFNFRSNQRWRELQKTVPDLSAQRIEDLASNTFIQIIASQISMSPDNVRYCCTDNGFDSIRSVVPVHDDVLYKKLPENLASDKPSRTVKEDFIYFARIFLKIINKEALAIKLFGAVTEQPVKTIEQPEKGRPVLSRFYLSDVSCIDISNDNEYIQCTVAIKAVWQACVLFKDGSVKHIHYSPEENMFGICLSRKKQIPPAKGELMVHRCPSCGGTVSAVTSVVCVYCGTKMNDGNLTWIVDKIFDKSQLNHYIEKHVPAEQFRMKPYYYSLYKPREIVFRNLAVIALADGSITEQEEKLLNRYRLKLWFGKCWAKEQIGLARSGRIRFEMPENKGLQKSMFRKMEQLILIDGTNAAETEYLKFLKRYYNC